jgi:Zn-dependent protease/CBS domain-containing protein
MKRASVVPVGRVLGIPVGLDYSWFLIFALLTWSLATGYFPAEFKNWPVAVYWITGAMTALMLFGSVVLHELGHSVIALRFKVPVRSITLFIFGGVAQIGGEPPSAKAEFQIAIAGPIVSFLLAAFFFVVKPLVAGIEPVWGLAKYLAYINFALALFNLVPGFPLDGGRVFRAIVWSVTRSFQKATVVAASVGRGFAFFFIAVGVLRMFTGNLVGGMWIAFIGWFLNSAAVAQLQQVTLRSLLAGYRVAQAMNQPPPVVPGTMPLRELVDEHILGTGRRCFVVTDDGHMRGLITMHRIKEVPRERWGTATAADAMLPLENLKRLSPETDLWPALEQMDRAGVNQLPVVEDRRIVGLLSRDDVISFLRTLQEVGA